MLLLKERTVPKTTSGKIQRRACKQGYLEWRDKDDADSGCCTALCKSSAQILTVVDSEASEGNAAAMDMASSYRCGAA